LGSLLLVRARLITLIALAGTTLTSSLPARRDSDAEESLFNVATKPGWSEFAESRWRPGFHDVRKWQPKDYDAPNAGTAYQVLACRTALVSVPMACQLLMIDLDVVADGVDGLILAEKDAFDPAVQITVNGVLLSDIIEAGSLTDRRRQLLLLTGTQPEHYVFGGQPGGLSADRERVLRQLMFKDVDIAYRPDLAPIRVPIDMNGPDLQSVFVWDSNTVAEGLHSYAHLADLRIFAMVMSNCQVLAAEQRCYEIREAALCEVTLDEIAETSTIDSRREYVIGRVRRVGLLRQTLSMGVEMYALGTTVAGGRPLRRYHESVMAESSLPHLLTVTQHLLAQLGETVGIEQQLLGVDEVREAAEKQIAIASSVRGLLDQSEAFKAASLVFASVAVVIGMAGLFTSSAAIPRSQRETLFGSVTGSVLFVAVAMAMAAALGFGLRRAARATLSPGARRIVRPLRWAGLGFLLLGLTLSIMPAFVTAGLVIVAMATIWVLFFLALELDFESPDSAVQRHGDSWSKA
jgi:hypothetical protein